NVIMGNARAVREGKWINRPKTGYDLIEGELVPNAQAPFIREVFRLRAAKTSLRSIADQTGLNYSTVDSILKSRIYLGEVLHNGEWFPGRHDAIISEEEWRAAQRSLGRGVQPSRDVLTGRVRCGLCGRRMALQQNGKGGTFYKCWHRGVGCDQSARSTKGLGRAVVKGLHLFGHDEGLRAAVRRRLSGRTGGSPVRGTRGRPASPAKALKTLTDKRRKLLELFFAEAISIEGFREAEKELLAAIEAVTGQVEREAQESRTHDDLEARFEQVAAILQNLDIEVLWSQATDEERRVLVEELVESVVVYPDHFEIRVHGAPPLTVLPGEVGMKGSQIVGVGDGT
ncbi:MAG: recombinase family protein, partial [Acidobacteriota bacterium]|nr:recombinase family protein [Acidobacteriota bacterium]